MFRHHKYCVIEVAGLLVGRIDRDGAFDLRLLDTQGALGPDRVNQADASSAIRICDGGLSDYIRQHASMGDRLDGEYRLQARITGNVDMDGGETRLADISQAILKDGDRVLRYDPDGLG